MFEEFQEAALKQEQRRRLKNILNISSGILFSVTLVYLTFYVN